MRIFLDGVNLSSNSGPNGFAKKLSLGLTALGHTIVDDKPNAQVSFISINKLIASCALRLDGIYFNSTQDFERLNDPIKASYDVADAVIVQSQFDKMLIENYFGKHRSISVIHNGVSFDEINSIPVFNNAKFNAFDKVWCCASSWRPHKRLRDNVAFFKECAGKNDCCVVAGAVENKDDFEFLNGLNVENDRVFYVGQLDRNALISLFKRSDVFVHLAWLDHCPNVVVDARACGCKIACSSSGGTKEIAGQAMLVMEEEWDFRPIKLYEPPRLDFSKLKKNEIESDIDIRTVSLNYVKVLEEISNECPSHG